MDIFINTTNYYNTPVSVIEALPLVMYIVSINPGGIPYLLEDGKDALLVKSRDSSIMAKKIIQLTGKPEMAKSLSVNALKKAESFSIEQIIPLWKQLFA